MTTTPARTATTTRNSHDDTTHVFCCNPDRALCGQDVSTEPEVPYGVGHDCIVCLDLEDQPCSRCGTRTP
jgi:hypothetical protein